MKKLNLLFGMVFLATNAFAQSPLEHFLKDVTNLPEVEVYRVVFPGSPQGQITLAYSYLGCREGVVTVEKLNYLGVHYFKIKTAPKEGEAPLNECGPEEGYGLIHAKSVLSAEEASKLVVINPVYRDYAK